MADGKDVAVSSNTVSSDSPPLSETGDQTRENSASKPSGLTYARRGEEVDDATVAQGVDGFDAERMRDRSLLTAEEEKKLMRRVDWRIMTVCSLLFLLKNLDSDNISNARIMNKGTDMNIMTQLKMTSDEYNLLTVLYYVSWSSVSLRRIWRLTDLDSIHCI